MLSFPPEIATATLSSNLSILYFATVALAFSSMDLVKHRLQSFSPEYGLEKKASLVLQAVQITGRVFIQASRSRRFSRTTKINQIQ
jgi:hypothetical protein